MSALIVPERRRCRAESQLWRIPARGTAAGLVRSRLRLQLTLWQLTELAPDLALVASELVSNSVRHGAPPIWCNLHLTTRADGVEFLRLIVADCGPGFDAMAADASWRRTAPLGREHGRGLLLVDHLADAWGTLRVEPFQLAWADLVTVR